MKVDSSSGFYGLVLGLRVCGLSLGYGFGTEVVGFWPDFFCFDVCLSAKAAKGVEVLGREARVAFQMTEETLDFAAGILSRRL